MLPFAIKSPAGIGTYLLVAAGWNGLVGAIDVDICASFNTASMGKYVSIYQTNGLCQDYCTPKNYAYAITQVNSCWCSNYTPDKSTEVSNDKCSSSCPGYPFEKCGGPAVFGYIVLNGALPAGTKGPNVPSTADDKPLPTMSTSTSSPSKSSRTESSTSTSTQPTSSSAEKITSSTSLPTSTTKPLRSSSVATVTADGTIKTVTIAPTQTGAPEPADNQSQDAPSRESGLKTGTVVGIVVGVVGGVLILAMAAIFLLFRRKKMQENNGYRDDPSVRDSSSGMMGSGRLDMSRSPNSTGSTGNRSSLLPVDPRMDPFRQSLYARNGSRESIGTLRDDHDYSRRIQTPKVLRATNPDPDVG